MNTSLTVLVSGATGNQGGAVVRALISKGHTVRALTRNTTSPAAKQVEALGAKIIQANMDNVESIGQALKGVDAFYLMGNPMDGVEAETKQGIALADAAKGADVGHLIYGSVANADLDTGIPHFDSKYKVEQHIKTLDLPYTISAPVFFMDNVIAPWSIDALKGGKIVQAMPGDRLLQQVSVKNIGDFVASLIERREAVFGQRYDFAGDELTGNETAKILTEKTRHEIDFESIPVSYVREQSEDMGLMFEWFDNVGYNVDIGSLHKDFSDVDWQDFSQWVESQSWEFL